MLTVLIAIAVLVATPMDVVAGPGEGPEPTAENEQLVTRYIEAFNAQDMDVLREVFADQVLVNGEAYDRDEYLESVQMYFLLSPNITMEPTFIVTTDEHVTLRLEFTGTGQGEFLGRDINGREYEVSEIMVFRVADGRFGEQWYEWDELGFLTQLGILENPYGQ